jgi:hypothetical protein
MIDLDQTPLSKFAYAVPNAEFLGTAAVWDSTPIEVEINGSPDIVRQYIHPHYRSLRAGHQTQAMRCIRYGFATLPNHLTLDQLKLQDPEYNKDFEEWSQGLPVVLTAEEFDPALLEGLCIGCSDGYLGATHDRVIFKATGIGRYITNGLSLVTDLGLQGQEALLGRSAKNRGTLHMKFKKPQHGELNQSQQMENGRISSFRKQIEDFNKKLKEFGMFAHRYRNNHNELDNWIKYAVGIINFNMLEKKNLVPRLRFYNPEDPESEEDDFDEMDSSEDEPVDVVTLALRSIK